MSGVKGENSIKLYGNDLQALTDTANKIKSVLATVQGITDLAVFTSLGQPTIQIDIDRARAARYGLAPGDINATDPHRDRRRQRRRSLRARQRPAFPDHRSPGAGIPQERRGDPELADRRAGAERHHADAAERGRHRSSWSPAPPISTANSRSAICRSSSRCASATSAAPSRRRRTRSHAQVQLPPGSRIEWVGEFGNLQDAIRRLSIVVPISLALIAMLLWFNFGSMVDTLLAMSVIPMAIFGGVLGLLVIGHSVQRLGRDRLHRAVRHLGDGRHHHPVAVQPADRRGHGPRPAPSCAPASCSCGRC